MTGVPVDRVVMLLRSGRRRWCRWPTSSIGQKQLVKDVTAIMADICGDPMQSKRTWVLLTEAAEGGWGIAGTAFGREEFATLAAAGAAAKK